MEKKTDINKVFGKMPEARELLDSDTEKERLEKVVKQIYEAGYNGKMGRHKENFDINKAIKEIETALDITSDSKRGASKKTKTVRDEYGDLF